MLHKDAGVSADFRGTRKANLERTNLSPKVAERSSKLVDAEILEAQRDVAVDGPSRGAVIGKNCAARDTRRPWRVNHALATNPVEQFA